MGLIMLAPTTGRVRAATSRKAEIRRMNARGAELIIKQQARRTHVDASEAVQAFKLSAVRPPAGAPDGDSPGSFSTFTRGSTGVRAPGRAAGDSPGFGAEACNLAPQPSFIEGWRKKSLKQWLCPPFSYC